jgi:hypothetical protein
MKIPPAFNGIGSIYEHKDLSSMASEPESSPIRIVEAITFLLPHFPIIFQIILLKKK